MQESNGRILVELRIVGFGLGVALYKFIKRGLIWGEWNESEGMGQRGVQR